MGVDVSQIENSSEKEQLEKEETVDLHKEFRIQYRLIRKQLSAFLREKFKKNFVNVLYVTAQTPPEEFIIAMQKQYPDKNIKVLIPLFEEKRNLEKTSIKFDYFMQNKMHSACVYKIPAGYENVQIFGVYTDVFSNIQAENDIYDIKYISHFSKIARKTALKLKPDFIHADNVPLLMGLELEGKWLTGYPIKYIQTLHNYTMYKDIEPFWAAINLANKNEMKKICNDNAIRSSLASIFNLNPDKKLKKTNAYINYIYTKYDEYRQNVDVNEETRENVLLRRMNDRIIKLFPKITVKDESLYNPAYLSMKQAVVRAVNASAEEPPAWAKMLRDVMVLPVKSGKTVNGKIRHPFDVINFRETRDLNKKYLVRELSEKRIEMKFIDIGLFEEDNVLIRGYLDSFFKAPLFFIWINEHTNSDDIKTASLAVLKAFELRKNIQVIYNYPKNLNNKYLNSLFEFFESQPALKGKWVAIEGKINIPQFISASDMILMPSGNCLGIESILYTALKYGCIPIVSKEGFDPDTVTDIFDDMSTGCAFKNSGISENYDDAFLKALEFYTSNPAPWNIVIKNAMNSNCGWDFKSLEKYNNIYEELI